MRVLLLGGTTFLGRHLVRVVLARGHTVATFTRGRVHPDPDLAIERYVGDRDGNFVALPRDGWDAVVDTSAHWPHVIIRCNESYKNVCALTYFRTTIEGGIS